MHDGLQLSKHILVRLWWVGVTTHCELDDGQTDRPDVRGDGVGADLTGTFSLDTFGLYEATRRDRCQIVLLLLLRAALDGDSQPCNSDNQYWSWPNSSRADPTLRNHTI
jgi:hypothetical protein